MTIGGPSGAAPGPEAALAQVYRDVTFFIGDRARRGDQMARVLEGELTQLAKPRPRRVDVRRWLGGVAAEHRLVRFDGDPWTAERLAAAMKACEGRAPGAAERIWTGTVDAIRSGGPR